MEIYRQFDQQFCPIIYRLAWLHWLIIISLGCSIISPLWLTIFAKISEITVGEKSLYFYLDILWWYFLFNNLVSIQEYLFLSLTILKHRIMCDNHQLCWRYYRYLFYLNLALSIIALCFGIMAGLILLKIDKLTQQTIKQFKIVIYIHFYQTLVGGLITYILSPAHFPFPH